MAGNPMTVVTNDTRAARVTGFPRHEMQEAMAGADTDSKIIDDEFGALFSVGRGENDPLIAYVSLYRNNTKYYIYVNDIGTGLVVTDVKP